MRPVAGRKSGPSAQSRASIACPLSAMSACANGSGAALRDLQLQPHQIEPGHGLGDGVLDLDARVHLQEIERAFVVEQEFDGAGADIADRAAARVAAAPIACRNSGETAGEGASSISF